MRPPSKARTRPAPRDVQTDQVSLLRAANLVLVAWGAHTPLVSYYVCARDRKEMERADLGVPTIAEEEEVEAIEDDVEGEASGDEEFTVEPAFAHGAGVLRAVPVSIRYQTSVVRPARQRNETGERVGERGRRGWRRRGKKRGDGVWAPNNEYQPGRVAWRYARLSTTQRAPAVPRLGAICSRPGLASRPCAHGDGPTSLARLQVLAIFDAPGRRPHSSNVFS